MLMVISYKILFLKLRYLIIIINKEYILKKLFLLLLSFLIS